MRNNRVLIIGVSVSDTKADTRTDDATTRPNSRNKRPVIPCRKITGKNTTASVTVVEMIANVISDDPFSPASRGSSPCSMRLKMFSIITIASSTTNPVARTTPKSVRRLMEKPKSHRKKNADTSDTGIATTGMIVARHERRNMKMISTTNPKAISSVSRTSSIALRMNVVESIASSRRRSFGACAWRSA